MSEWWRVDSSCDYWCSPSAYPRNRRWARCSTTPRRSRLCSSLPQVCHRARSRSRAHWDNSRPRRARPPRRCTIPVAHSPQSRCIRRGRPSWSTMPGRSRRNRCFVASCCLALLDITHRIKLSRSFVREPCHEARALSWSREPFFRAPLSPARLIALPGVTALIAIGISWLSHF